MKIFSTDLQRGGVAPGCQPHYAGRDGARARIRGMPRIEGRACKGQPHYFLLQKSIRHASPCVLMFESARRTKMMSFCRMP